MSPCLSGAPSGTNLLLDREGIRKWKWYLAPAQTITSSVFDGKHFQYRFSVTFKCYNTNQSIFIMGKLGAKTGMSTSFFYSIFTIDNIWYKLASLINHADQLIDSRKI